MNTQTAVRILKSTKGEFPLRLVLIPFRGAWGYLSRFLGGGQGESFGVGGRLGVGFWGGNRRVGGGFCGNGWFQGVGRRGVVFGWHGVLAGFHGGKVRRQWESGRWHAEIPRSLLAC